MPARTIRIVAAASAALLLGGAAPPAPAPIALWRLDCGRISGEETGAPPWRKRLLPVGCYLIRNGGRYLLWDAGMSARLAGNPRPNMALDRTLVDQLADIGVAPGAVEYVGISHYHGDHTGQASKFPKAKLLIGAGDLAALKASPPPAGSSPDHLAPWISGGAPVAALIEDLDVFGDGRVTMLMTPGHTPGHASLLVRLASGNILLSGDLWQNHGDVLTDAMPGFNTSPAETAASRERFRRLAYKLDATVILQHEQADIDKLPPFPQPAQ